MKRQVPRARLCVNFKILLAAACLALFCLPANAQTLHQRKDLFRIFREGKLIATPPLLPDQRPLLSKEPKPPLSYTFKRVDVPGAVFTNPRGINQFGEIVGHYVNGYSDLNHGFKLTKFGEYVTVDLPGAIDNELMGINRHGQIIGVFIDTSNVSYDVLLNKTLDQYDVINFPDRIFSGYVSGLNDSAQIVGTSFEYTTGDFDERGFLLNNGVFTNFNFPGAYRTSARGINNFGKIVGNYNTFPYSPYIDDFHGFVLDASNVEVGGTPGIENFTPIDFPGADATAVSGINNKGDIVGVYQVGPNPGNEVHGFLFSKGTFYTFDFPGALHSALVGINQSGQIIGNAYDYENGSYAFLAEPKVRKQ